MARPGEGGNDDRNDFDAKLERALAGSVRADLESRGHPWASVSADGQRIKLSGAAPDGAALGAVATGLRVVLGIERSHLGAD